MILLVKLVWLAYGCGSEGITCVGENTTISVCYDELPWPFEKHIWKYDDVTLEVVNLGICRQS